MSKEQVNHPDHYNSYPIEAIDMMIKIWGIESTTDFCYMNAFKYRMRLGLKDNIEQDLKKEQWYLNKAKELEKLLNGNGSALEQAKMPLFNNKSI